MIDRTGLWWGTVEGADIDTLAGAAATAGFDDISITPAMYFAARRAGRSDDDLRAMLADHGVAVAVIDPLLRGLPGSLAPEAVGPRFRSTFEHDEADCLRAAAAVGARAINVAHFLGTPTARGALVEAIGGIAERGAASDVDVLVEFMPDGSIPDLAAAAEIVAAIDAPNCRLMFDTWHHWRCGGDVAQVRALRAGAIGAVQVSDAGIDTFGSGTTPPSRDRLLPGDGEIPLVELVAAAVENNPATLLGLEVFSASLTELPPEERARRAKRSLDALLSCVNAR